jgi:hypothetical protein
MARLRVIAGRRGVRLATLAATGVLLALLAWPGAGDPVLPCTGHADCDDRRWCTGEERCDPGAAGADARGCVAGHDPCGGATPVCNEIEARCEEVPCEDRDRDGHEDIACGGDDCDDEDAGRYPGNREVCDEAGYDEDCNLATFGEVDEDGDGYIDARCWNDPRQ